MARPKNKKSKGTFNNIGLTPDEDDKLVKLLDEKDISYRQLQRALTRQWINEGGTGVLRYNKY